MRSGPSPRQAAAQLSGANTARGSRRADLGGAVPRAGEGGARSPLAQRKRSRGPLWVLRQVTNPNLSLPSPPSPSKPLRTSEGTGEVRNVPPSPQVPVASVEGGLGILADPPGGAEALRTCAQGKEGQGQLGVPRKRNGSPGRRNMGSVTAAESACEPGAGRARSTRLLRAVRGARSAGRGDQRAGACASCGGGNTGARTARLVAAQTRPLPAPRPQDLQGTGRGAFSRRFRGWAGGPSVPCPSTLGGCQLSWLAAASLQISASIFRVAFSSFITCRDVCHWA